MVVASPIGICPVRTLFPIRLNAALISSDGEINDTTSGVPRRSLTGLLLPLLLACL